MPLNLFCGDIIEKHMRTSTDGILPYWFDVLALRNLFEVTNNSADG